VSKDCRREGNAQPQFASQGQTYGQILKSSAVIGGSSAVNIGFRIVRTKIMAVLLGPAGIGLLGLYGSVADLSGSVIGMGLNSSGVRQIAEAAGTGDAPRIARTVTALRRVALCCGALGTLLLVIFKDALSQLTFGDHQHGRSIALLSLAVFFTVVSGAQTAVVQGMRRIVDLARINVLGAFFSTLLGVLVVYLYYRFGRAADGVVPSLVCVAAMGVVTSWWYARKIKVEQVKTTSRQVVDEISALLKMGMAFMTAGVLLVGSGYAARIIILQTLSLEAAGYYQSAWAIGGLYVGFILDAMGADFFPRLTAVAHKDGESNRLVNEQVEIGLLLAVPGTIGMLAFAPAMIELFYGAKFGPAVGVVRWICLGMILRIVTWPMGYLLLAKGKRNLFIWTELLKNLSYVAMVWLGIRFFGLAGTGMAFFCMYVAYYAIIYTAANRVSGFAWSAANRRLAFLFAPPIAIVGFSWHFLPSIPALIVGVVLALVTGILSLRKLTTLVPLQRMPAIVQKMLTVFRLTPDASGPS
jgi:PST family polysaccharide transporter